MDPPAIFNLSLPLCALWQSVFDELAQIQPAGQFTSGCLQFGFVSETATSFAGKHIRVGLFERCHRGTVLLNEITALPWRWEARLIDLLDEQRLCRLGGGSWVKVDVRIVVSTSTNIGMAMAVREQ